MAANRFISFLVLFLALSMCFVADAKRFGKHHRRSEASVFSYDSWLDKNTKSFFTEDKMPTCCRTTDLIAPVVRDVASEIYEKFPKQQPLNIISICTGAARLEAALVATLADAGQRVKTLVVMVDEGTQESPTTVLSELTMALSSEEVKPGTIYNFGWRFRDLKKILSSEFDGTADNTVVVAFNPQYSNDFSASRAFYAKGIEPARLDELDKAFTTALLVGVNSVDLTSEGKKFTTECVKTEREQNYCRYNVDRVAQQHTDDSEGALVLKDFFYVESCVGCGGLHSSATFGGDEFSKSIRSDCIRFTRAAFFMGAESYNVDKCV